MGNIYMVPNWFFGYDILLELAFAVITLIVSIYAFKVSKLSEQRQPRLFGISFLLISASYFVQSFVNFAIISKMNENICTVLKINDVTALNLVGVYFYIILFTIGLTTLTYMTLRQKNIKIFSLITILALLLIILSSNTLYVFYLISSILLVYIVIHYLKNYLKNKKTKTLLILIAFAFILFAKIHFIFSVNHQLYYAIGHILEGIAYLLILINLILVTRK